MEKQRVIEESPKLTGMNKNDLIVITGAGGLIAASNSNMNPANWVGGSSNRHSAKHPHVPEGLEVGW